MTYSTTNTFKMIREILNFVEKISANTYRPQKKFMADIIYGMLASGSCLLTKVAQELCEDSRKINVVDRLSMHLAEDDLSLAQNNYLESICKMVPDYPVIHIDDSDVVKPEGQQFESLGWVRDGSKSTKDKKVISKGYHVTEACVSTKTGHPVSFFSELHSSLEKDFTSISKVPVYLVLVYGTTEHPMMLVTNKAIRSKEDLMEITKLYFSRWRVEEYFRCKKQMFDFENFRVRSLKAINALNFCLSSCMAFLGNMEGKSPTNKLRNTIIEAADPIKKKVYFQYYRIASGVS